MKHAPQVLAATLLVLAPSAHAQPSRYFRIVERGRHAELLAKNGAYARLYAAQFRDEDSMEAA
jgi:hypothetical protein